MKNFTTLLIIGTVAGASTTSGTIIAAWDVWSGTTTYDASFTNGVTAQAVGTSTTDGAGWGSWVNAANASTDGTWGSQSFSPAPSTTAGG